ncbi:MAG TPA: hypothetical protein VE547_14925 [Mycobacteriales bacterium]|nr:hypothetical protein [Mycobacteriales bacterium]
MPKQLQRAGMTGDVPYYGGRLTPAQAYAVSHPAVRPSPPPRDRPVRPSPPPRNRADQLRSLQDLLDTEVITPEEYAGLRARLDA